MPRPFDPMKADFSSRSHGLYPELSNFSKTRRFHLFHILIHYFTIFHLGSGRLNIYSVFAYDSYNIRLRLCLSEVCLPPVSRKWLWLHPSRLSRITHSHSQTPSRTHGRGTPTVHVSFHARFRTESRRHIRAPMNR